MTKLIGLLALVAVLSACSPSDYKTNFDDSNSRNIKVRKFHLNNGMGTPCYWVWLGDSSYNGGPVCDFSKDGENHILTDAEIKLLVKP